MHPIFEIKQVSYTYHTMQGGIPALSDITFSVSLGEFIAIVGPSGCGKSTLLNLLCGLNTPETGNILSRVVLPSNIPNLFSIMKVDIGLCLVGVIIGEFISSRRGLGYMIIYGSQIFNFQRRILVTLVVRGMRQINFFVFSMGFIPALKIEASGGSQAR